MDDNYRQIGQATPAYEDLGPTRLSTCGDKPTPKSAPPAGIRKLIAELGLRYRPNDRADLEAHAAKLALLASDVADIPERPLRAAIAEWIARKPYLPKASELIEMARAHLTGPRRQADGDAEKRRAMLVEMNRSNMRQDCVWEIDAGGSFYLKDL